MSHPFFGLPTPLVIGHRGAAGEVPENTLASFAHAVASGAVILESDVHACGDGTLILLHDDDVDRTTDGRGPVSGLSLAELRRLDAGHHFTADAGASFPFRGKGLRVPSLEEAFEAFPGVRFNLELKQARPGLVENALSVVARARRAETTLLTAAEDNLMAALRVQVRASGVAVALGAAAGDVLRFVAAALRREPPPPGPMALQIPAEYAGRPLVTRELVAHAHAHGIQVHVWTINEPAEMQRLLELGVDGLVTDFPARLAALLAAGRARPPAPGSR